MHMGFPKTGTTSIQEFLFSNREALLQNGICYPKPPEDVQITDCLEHGHASACSWFVETYASRWKWWERREQFCKEMKESQCELNIMSSENFVYEHTDNISYYLTDFEVKGIYYFRSFFDYLLSLQKTFIRNCLRPDVFTFDYYRNLRILGSLRHQIKLLGRQNCIFKDFDKLRSEKMTIIDDFLETVGVAEKSCYKPVNTLNTTPSDVVHAFLYQISFLPINFSQYMLLKKDLYTLDLGQYSWYKFNPLPQAVYKLDDFAKEAIRFQGELLNDPDWYDKTIERRMVISSITYQDLPAEIQRYIFDNISNAMQSLLRTWLTIPDNKDAFLPSMADIELFKYRILPLYIDHTAKAKKFFLQASVQ